MMKKEKKKRSILNLKPTRFSTSMKKDKNKEKGFSTNLKRKKQENVIKRDYRMINRFFMILKCYEGVWVENKREQ